MTKRKFYKTTLKVVVLSEYPLEYDSLKDVSYLIAQGDCSGEIIDDKRVTLSGRQTAKALIKQGSEPGFFQIDKDGNDTVDNVEDILE